METFLGKESQEKITSMSRRSHADEDAGFQYHVIQNAQNTMKGNNQGSHHHHHKHANAVHSVVHGATNNATNNANKISPFLLASTNPVPMEEGYYLDEEPVGLPMKLKSLVSNEDVISFAQGLTFEDGPSAQVSSNAHAKNAMKKQQHQVGSGAAAIKSKSAGSGFGSAKQQKHKRAASVCM